MKRHVERELKWEKNPLGIKETNEKVNATYYKQKISKEVKGGDINVQSFVN